MNPTDILKTQDTKMLIKDYSALSRENNQELRKIDLNSWTKDGLDKACFNLIYADKIGSFTDVYAMLAYIESAQKSGINIDDNSYGVTKKLREEIKLRADLAINIARTGPPQE